MSALTEKQARQLKEKISEKPTKYLDLLFDLLPKEIGQAENILQLMDELVREKKLDRYLLYRYMEEPTYFQDESCQDFYKRDPLIARIVKEGGLPLFNYYLHFKYDSVLSAELLSLHDIFVFRLPPITRYIDKTHWPVFATKDEKARITKKYYELTDMTYGLFNDVLQDKSLSILKRLAECEYDFNKSSNLEYLKQWMYFHREDVYQFDDATVLFLLEHGLKPNTYLELFLSEWHTEFSLLTATTANNQLIHLCNLLLDNGAKLEHFPSEFLEKLRRLLELAREEMDAFVHTQSQRQTSDEIAYLYAHIIEAISSLEEAKPYYLKMGIRGERALQRKTLVNLLESIKSFSRE